MPSCRWEEEYGHFVDGVHQWGEEDSFHCGVAKDQLPTHAGPKGSVASPGAIDGIPDQPEGLQPSAQR